MPDSSGAIDLGSLSPEEQEAVNRMAEENGITGDEPTREDTGPKRQKVLTAFIVLVGEDGNPTVLNYEDDERIETHVPVTPDLIYGACATIQKDIAAMETAQASAAATGQFMMQQARAAQEQMQNAAIQAQLQQSGLKR